MALTATQILDMQGDLGITADETVFSDTELNRLYTRAEESYELAIYYGYRQLLADANKYHEYTAGLSREKLDQVRAHLKDSMIMWKDEARSASNQVWSVGILEVPPRDKDEPYDA